MAGEFQWSGYKASATTYLSTELNSLADGANKLGGSIDNSTNKYKYIDIELYLASAAFTSNPHIKIYILPSVDGTNYADGGDSTDPVDTNDLYVIQLREATAAQYQVLRKVEIPTGLFKILVMSEAGVALAASGNTLKYRPYNDAYT